MSAETLLPLKSNSNLVQSGMSSVTDEDDALTFVISHPAPFECVIEPRSAASLALIQHAHLEVK